MAKSTPTRFVRVPDAFFRVREFNSNIYILGIQGEELRGLCLCLNHMRAV